MTGQEIRLVRRPDGRPTADCFAAFPATVGDPGPGQLVVRSRTLSVDPSMLPRMVVDTYAPMFALDAVPDGRAVGQVVASRSERYREGDWVLHGAGWRSHALLHEDDPGLRRIEPREGVPPESWLGVLGAPGLTAYVGLLDVAGLRAGETVWVSAAAGAVGSVVGQLAKARGAALVVGSAGGADKVRHLVEDLRFDRAIDYRAEADLAAAVSAAAPDGLDVYFDNVGGEHLEAALGALRIGGRVAACGMIGQYGGGRPSAPRNLSALITRRLTVRGFLVLDHLDRAAAFEEEVGALVAEGLMHARTTEVEGIAQAPQALLSLLDGANVGKLLVRV